MSMWNPGCGFREPPRKVRITMEVITIGSETDEHGNDWLILHDGRRILLCGSKVAISRIKNPDDQAMIMRGVPIESPGHPDYVDGSDYHKEVAANSGMYHWAWSYWKACYKKGTSPRMRGELAANEIKDWSAFYGKAENISPIKRGSP